LWRTYSCWWEGCGGFTTHTWAKKSEPESTGRPSGTASSESCWTSAVCRCSWQMSIFGWLMTWRLPCQRHRAASSTLPRGGGAGEEDDEEDEDDEDGEDAETGAAARQQLQQQQLLRAGMGGRRAEQERAEREAQAERHVQHLRSMFSNLEAEVVDKAWADSRGNLTVCVEHLSAMSEALLRPVTTLQSPMPTSMGHESLTNEHGQQECVICFGSVVDAVLLPCQHSGLCVGVSTSLDQSVTQLIRASLLPSTPSLTLYYSHLPQLVCRKSAAAEPSRVPDVPEHGV